MRFWSAGHIVIYAKIHEKFWCCGGPFACPCPMSLSEIARYAEQVNALYTTTSGAELYRIAEMVPRTHRIAFEEALGDTIEAYYGELARRGQKPDEKPIPDLLALYVLPGLVASAELYVGFQLARRQLMRTQVAMRAAKRDGLVAAKGMPFHQLTRRLKDGLEIG